MSASLDHSEDEGQLRSRENSDDNATNDSLEIKPPQSKSYKEKKKHKRSHERKHKERHRDYSREKESRFSPESRRAYHEKYDEKKTYYKEKEYYSKRDYDNSQRDKMRKSDGQQESRSSRRTTPEEPLKFDNDRREEDLRNRLIKRRQQEGSESSGRSKDERYKDKRDYKREYAEEFEDYDDSRKHRGHRQHQQQFDPEAEARRKKFLDAGRDDRKQKARQELEARREQHHRTKDVRSREVSPSPDRKKQRYESSEEERHTKVSGSAASAVIAEVVTVSSEPSEHAEEDDVLEEIDTESDSHSSKSKEESEDFEMSPEERIPLEKSPRREEISRSVSSHSRSPSHESRSPRSKTRSHSRSRSESTSSTDSRSDSSKSTGSDTDEEKRKSDHDDDDNNGVEAKKKEKTPPKLDETMKELNVTAEEEKLPPYFPALQGCRSVEEFQCLNRIEEGTYGVVYRAKDKRSDEIVALKRLKMEKEKEGFPITSLREINTLLKGQHPNIVTVREIVVGSNMDKIFIVMDYVEHDLKSLIETMKYKKQVFLPAEVKCLIQQLMRAVAHLHDNWILHR